MDVKNEFQKVTSLKVIEKIDKSFMLGKKHFGGYSKDKYSNDNTFKSSFNKQMLKFNKFLDGLDLDEKTRKHIFEIYRCFILGKNEYGSVF